MPTNKQGNIFTLEFTSTTKGETMSFDFPNNLSLCGMTTVPCSVCVCIKERQTWNGKFNCKSSQHSKGIEAYVYAALWLAMAVLQTRLS